MVCRPPPSPRVSAGWPFIAYVVLTITGLAALGIGLLAAGYPTWLGWVVIGADLAFLVCTP